MTVQAHDRRRSVVATAATLFEQQGYHNTSMSDVAHAVHLAKPSLYHYFPNGKMEILFEIHEEFFGALMGLQAARGGTAASPVEGLRAMMGDIVSVMESHRSYVHVFFAYYQDLSDERLDVVRTNAARYRGIMEDILAAGVRSGAFYPVDVRLATLAIFGMCNWMYHWYRDDGRLRPAQIAEEFAAMVMRGLRADSLAGTTGTAGPSPGPPPTTGTATGHRCPHCHGPVDVVTTVASPGRGGGPKGP